MKTQYLVNNCDFGQINETFNFNMTYSFSNDTIKFQCFHDVKEAPAKAGICASSVQIRCWSIPPLLILVLALPAFVISRIINTYRSATLSTPTRLSQPLWKRIFWLIHQQWKEWEWLDSLTSMCCSSEPPRELAEEWQTVWSKLGSK